MDNDSTYGGSDSEDEGVTAPPPTTDQPRYARGPRPPTAPVDEDARFNAAPQSNDQAFGRDQDAYAPPARDSSGRQPVGVDEGIDVGDDPYDRDSPQQQRKAGPPAPASSYSDTDYNDPQDSDASLGDVRDAPNTQQGYNDVGRDPIGDVQSRRVDDGDVDDPDQRKSGYGTAAAVGGGALAGGAVVGGAAYATDRQTGDQVDDYDSEFGSLWPISFARS